MHRRTTPRAVTRLAVRPALLLAAISAGCAEPTPDPGGAGAGPAEPLPAGAEARSLLGEPLFPPTLPDETRATYEARLAEAEADVQASPDDVDALIWLGRRLAYLGRYGEAIDTYSRAMTIAPDDPRLYRHRGHRFITTRRFDRAVADFRRAVELVEGKPDEVEPDGLPNARGVPTSTLHFNIWYHLGLAHYLKGEFEEALLAWNECLRVSKHVDSVVATSYWLVNVLERLGLDARSAEILSGIRADMDIIEVGAYLDVLLLHKGERTLEEIVGDGEGEATLESTTAAYGVGNWHFINGRRAEAYRIWEATVDQESQWAAFGYIASEAELARDRR